MNTPSTYVAVRRARETDRHHRGVKACACGAEYRDTPDGRRTHQMLHGHRPSQDRSAR